MAASASNPLGIRTENVDVVLGGDTVLVTLVYASSEQDLNSNNLAVDHPLYRVLELNSETPAPLPVYDKSKPMCELCLRTFSSFSVHYSLCYLISILILSYHDVGFAGNVQA